MIQNLQIITPGHPSVSPQQSEQFLSTVSFRLTIGWPMKTSSSASPQPVIYDRFPPLSEWSLCRPIHRYRPSGIPSINKALFTLSVLICDSSFSSIFFNSGEEGRGTSTDTIFPFLSKTINCGIPVIFGNLAPTAGQ